MKQVRERIYISTSNDAGIYINGITQGFTHILSVAPVCLQPDCNFIDEVFPHRLHKFQSVETKLREVCSDSAPSLVRKIVPIQDTEEQELLSILPECFEFIDQGIEHGMVLVHCIGGRSRSASVIIAYLMWKEGLGLDEAIEELVKCRKGVRPNDGFLKQLREFESMLKVGGYQQQMPKQMNQTSEQATEFTCKLCCRSFAHK